MTTISSAGIGSGLDVASLVAQLVSAERAPAQARISGAQSKLNVQLSALGTFRSALADLQTKARALLADGAVNALEARSSAAEQFRATAGASAAAGSYEIEILALAQPHKLASGAYPDGATTVLGAGTVEISAGESTFTVTLTEGADTLGDLRSLINQASDNTGVSATLIHETGGTRLLLTAREPGLAQALTVTSPLLALTERQPAADAHIRIEGYDHRASGNSIAGAIDGVTLQLLGAQPGQVHRLEVAPDGEAVSKAVTAFVQSYNAAVSLAGSLTRYDPATQKASPLTGDAAVRGTMQSLRSLVGAQLPENAYQVLAQVGLTTRTDGTLALDSAAFAAALADDRAAVEALFAGEAGIATRIAAALDGVVGDDGQVEAKTDSLQSRLKDLGRQQQRLDLRMDQVQARYQAQFSALDSLIARMNTTSSFLTQQLANLAALTRG